MAKVWVKGFTRSDGTKVKGHYRDASKMYDKLMEKVNKTPLYKSTAKLEEAIRRMAINDARSRGY